MIVFDVFGVFNVLGAFEMFDMREGNMCCGKS